MKKEQQEKETIRIKNSFGYSKSYDYSLGLLRRRQNLKKSLSYKSVVFCAHNSVVVKNSTKIFQNKCGQVVLYKL